MKYTTAAALLALTTLLTSCNAPKVQSKCSADFNFSRPQTFQWIEAPAELMEQGNTFTHIAIQQALNNELAGRGLQQVLETEQADLQAVYVVTLIEVEHQPALDSDGENKHAGGFTFKFQQGWSARERQPETSTYPSEKGLFNLYLIDTQTGEHVWQGTLETAIDRTRPLAEQEEWLRLTARKLMKSIPRNVQ